MIGPYLSRLAPDDVDSSPKEKVRGGVVTNKDKEPMKLASIANDKILISSSVGVFPSLSLVAV